MKVILINKKIQSRFHIFMLLIILNLGFIIRMYHLSNNPAGFFCDEASIGYNAYSLLTTGKDEYGMSLPIFFHSLGDFRPPIAFYSAAPFISLFGLTELATRLPSVVYGVLTILIMYLIGKELSPKNKSLGLWTAFTTATMPWLIHYNRTGFEFTSYVTFFTLTILLLLKTVHSKFFIIPAFIIAALTLYTYQPARLLVPLLLIGFLWIHKKMFLLHKKYTYAAFLSFFILSIPLILSFFSGEGLARFSMVSVFSAKIPLLQTALRILQNYLTQLSPGFFISGEPTFITRHFVGGLTPLLITTLPFSFIGIITVFFASKTDKSSRLIIYWLLIYPIAGAVTADAPFTSRSIIGAPLFVILICIGIRTTAMYLRKFMPSSLTSMIICLVILINLVFFARFYFIQYPLYSANFWGWQYGARDIVQYFTAHEKSYDDLIMAPVFNAPDIFFKFYAPHTCVKCKVGLPDNTYIKGRRQLFAITPEYLQSHPQFSYKQIRTLYYPNRGVSFILVEITN